MGAQGTTTIDFGTFPGGSDALVNITGQASILSGSLVEAWIAPTATADHTADEHLVETIRVVAGNVVAGTGFTIYGVNTNQLNEPVMPAIGANSIFSSSATAIGIKNAQPGVGGGGGGGRGTRIWGLWTVNWVWN